MSKKDYQAIARELYFTRAAAFASQGVADETSADMGTVTAARWIFETMARQLADVLAADNPRFDRARFIEACETGKCKGMAS